MPDAASRSNGGPRFKLARGRARAFASPRASAVDGRRTRYRASGIRRGASRSHGVRFGRSALRQIGRTATEARVRSPSGISAYQAETERWSGIRTRDPMIPSHLLYPTELSSLRETDRNRTCDLRVCTRRSATELQPLLRSAEHETATRPAPAGTTTRTQGRAKVRAYDRV